MTSLEAEFREREEVDSMGIEVGGIIGLLILIADVWAVVNIFQSRATTGAKVFWTVLILILPLLGLVIWLIAGPRGSRA